MSYEPPTLRSCSARPWPWGPSGLRRCPVLPVEPPEGSRRIWIVALGKSANAAAPGPTEYPPQWRCCWSSRSRVAVTGRDSNTYHVGFTGAVPEGPRRHLLGRRKPSITDRDNPLCDVGRRRARGPRQPLVPDGRTVLPDHPPPSGQPVIWATAAPPSFIPGTNLAERSFVEERRRTKVIGRFTDERSAMNLVFATMIRAAQRWCRVSINDLETEAAAANCGCSAPSSDSTRRRRPTNANQPTQEHAA